jgi:multidrug efflux pump subunit AcrA (membrane-fusion protein)
VAERAAPAQDLDQAISQQSISEAAIKADRAAIAQAQLNLDYTTISSPIDGIIGKLAVTQGNLVGKGENTLLATISSYDPMYVYFAMPEAVYLSFFKKKDLGGTEGVELVLADGSRYES